MAIVEFEKDSVLRIIGEKFEVINYGDDNFELEVIYEGRKFKGYDHFLEPAQIKLIEAVLVYLKPQIDEEAAKLKDWNEGKAIQGGSMRPTKQALAK